MGKKQEWTAAGLNCAALQRVRQHKDDPMSRIVDYFFLPQKYLSNGDRLLQCLPLIDTSLSKLSAAGWCLSVECRYVRGYNHTKIKYHFSDPDKGGNPHLCLRFWVNGCKMTEKDVLDLLLEKDLFLSFNKPPSFVINRREPVVVVNTEIKEVQVLVDESELEFVQRINDARAKALKKKKKIDTNYEEIEKELLLKSA